MTFKWTPDPSRPGILEIKNLKPNDSRWMQTLTVSPSRWYRVSGWIRSENVSTNGGLGAYIDDMDNDFQSTDFRGKGWQQVKFWMKTGPSQHSALLHAGWAATRRSTPARLLHRGLLMQVERPPRGAEPVYGCGSWDFHGFTDYCGQLPFWSGPSARSF